MLVIFLDIDGVVNIMSPSYNSSAYRPDGSVRWMEEHLVQRLNYLVEKSGAEIVISSSWRLDMKDLEKQLVKNGFKHWDKVQGETPYFGHRGDEIQKYLVEHPEVEGYVVLEDEIDDVNGEKCQAIPMDNIVEVDMRNGLSDQNITKAKNILYNQEVHDD